LDVGGDFGHGGRGRSDVFTKVEEEGGEVCTGLGQGESADGYGEWVHGVAVIGRLLCLMPCTANDFRKMIFRKQRACLEGYERNAILQPL